MKESMRICVFYHSTGAVAEISIDSIVGRPFEPDRGNSRGRDCER